MIPHFIGWWPYTAAWVVFFNFFLAQLNDLRREDEALFERIPDFVPYAVGGTCLFFTSFTFVQVSPLPTLTVRRPPTPRQ